MGMYICTGMHSVRKEFPWDNEGSARWRLTCMLRKSSSMTSPTMKGREMPGLLPGTVWKNMAEQAVALSQAFAAGGSSKHPRKGPATLGLQPGALTKPCTVDVRTLDAWSVSPAL